MKKGDIVRVTTQCVPKGLVPVYYVVLVYEYAISGGTKWYAVLTERPDDTSLIKDIDSLRIYLLKPEINSQP